MSKTRPAFSYRPEELSRELRPYYISASEQDIQDMLQELSLTSPEDVFSHLKEEVKFTRNLEVEPRLEYLALADTLFEISQKNKIMTSFIGDGLPVIKEADIINEICAIRGLTTAYTPYQPERSQGTLRSLWIYQSALTAITGFEAINASLYERSTCLYEAIQTGFRLHKKSHVALVSEALYPGDKEVLDTQSKFTDTQIIYYPIDQKTGQTDFEKLQKLMEKYQAAVLVYPQVNSYGNLEDVDQLQDLSSQRGLKTVAIIDPVLIANKALKAPIHFGSDQQGSDMIVGEGQHLALGANFGGPGLGIFGIRFNEQNKVGIRSTAGRYVGKAKDAKGRDCLSMVLSTREQHIRREKATSNICSNQSFVASLAGACLMRRGSEGLSSAAQTARDNALKAAWELLAFEGIELLYPDTPFYNELTLKVQKELSELSLAAQKESLEIGVDMSKRVQAAGNYLKISFNDKQTSTDIDQLIAFFAKHFSKKQNPDIHIPEIPERLRRKDSFHIPSMSRDEVISYYQSLGKQNISPDDGIYPLGSCTMKYNPYINDWAASLEGFTQVHPQSHESNVQGSLEVLYKIQEGFKAITGLAGVTTQPVAGAQGELVGIKMFQAYHEAKGEDEQRKLILIPKSAHGTNPATATVAGFKTIKKDGKPYGIIGLEADDRGMVDMNQLKEVIQEHGPRIAGVMVTNPNTAGIFEENFKEMAELIHAVGGLVYMDGANMNAIAGIVNLDKIGVDAVHNNLHKTWTIPHGGGGPGDAIVAVSDRLVDFLPGVQIRCENGYYSTFKSVKSIGSFHRHFGNFAHKVRTYSYLRALGPEGIRKMSTVSVLSAQYLFKKLITDYPTLPKKTETVPRMHEFIISLSEESFERIQKAGIPKAKIIARIGKLFLDFGFHAPTVAFPEQYGLMIEPTESFSKAELDQFAQVVKAINTVIHEKPEILITVPHFTPIDMVDEVSANKNLVLFEELSSATPQAETDRFDQSRLREMPTKQVVEKILAL